MSDERHPAQELADLVSELRQLTQTWRGVGADQVPWEGRGPEWPEHPGADAPTASSTVEATRASPQPAPARSTDADLPPPGASARLFPQAEQPRPRGLPPRREAPDRPNRWQGYGQRADPEQAMAALREKLGDCELCPVLARGRTNIVFGVGNPRARLVVVGEAPGFHEDQQGEPFVGPAGQMLDRMLANVVGLPRERVYIMNVLKCRPPDNRDPEPAEVAACRPFLDAQLNIVRPAAILALGRYATQSLLDSPRGIKALRGRWASYRGIAVMPTFHPAYLLRQPQDKRLTLQDLLALKQHLEQQGPLDG
jgi:uracil-DNA glycosylase family 4